MLTRTNHTTRRTTRAPRRGFTLIETALAIVIVGVGVVSIMMAQAAFHQQNTWSTQASIATQLGNEIREMTIHLPARDPVTGDLFWGPEPGELFADFDDLDDFDGTGTGLLFSADNGDGPVNARREVIDNMDGWSQEVRVFNVNPFNVTDSTPADGATSTIMVEVVVYFRPVGETDPIEMTTVSWIAPN
ncbi:MAG: prepilin-type N-terminal cleavage/methylation domain-containing protein [Planctomycetota bacterium]